MDFLVLIGRILFVLLFLSSGFGHIAARAQMAGYAQSKKVPFALVTVVASGVWLILGALSVLLGVWPDLGALMLFVFLVPTAVVMHGFWSETDPQTKQTEMVSFQKDIALAGAALMLFALFSEFDGVIGLTLTEPLF